MVTLLRLQLTDFMNIESLDLEFSETGYTLISGENGSGKSAVFAAIALALIEYRKGDSYKDFTRRGQPFSKIVLDILFRGNPMHFDITINNDKYTTPLTRKIVYEDKVYNNSECTAFLESLDIGYLQHVMFLFQRDNSIVDLKPGERAKLLKRLFHIEFDGQVERLRSQLDAEESLLRDATIRLDELSKRTFTTVPLLEQNCSLDQKITYSGELDEVTKQLASMPDYDEEKLTEAKLEEKRLATSRVEILNQIEKLHRVINDGTTNQAYEDKIISDLKLQLETLTKGFQPINEEEYSTSALSLLKQIAEESTELKELEKVHKLKKSQLDIYKTGICHVCGQEVDDTKIPGFEVELLALEQDISTKKKNIRWLEHEKRAIDDVLAAHKSLTKQLNEVTADLATHNQVVKQIQASITSSLLLLDEKLKSKELIEQQLAIARASLKSLQELESNIAERDRIEKRKNQLAALLMTYERTATINAEREKQNATIVADGEIHKEALNDLASKINTSSRLVDALTKALAIFESEFPNFIILRRCAQIEAAMNEFIQRVFPYMKVQLSQNRSGVEFYYTPSYVDGQEAEWLSVKMASGAQASILGLAWRVAVAEIYGITTILLDEVDSDSTVENSKLIYEFIGSLSFDQVLLISHKKEAIRAVSALVDDSTCYWVDGGSYNQIDPDSLD